VAPPAAAGSKGYVENTHTGIWDVVELQTPGARIGWEVDEARVTLEGVDLAVMPPCGVYPSPPHAGMPATQAAWRSAMSGSPSCCAMTSGGRHRIPGGLWSGGSPRRVGGSFGGPRGLLGNRAHHSGLQAEIEARYVRVVGGSNVSPVWAGAAFGEAAERTPGLQACVCVLSSNMVRGAPSSVVPLKIRGPIPRPRTACLFPSRCA
jgi:hypothetical protein